MDETPQAQLKILRDRLAVAAPRARTGAQLPDELIRRIEAAKEQVAELYLLTVRKTAPAEALAMLIDDAIVEGYVLLRQLADRAEQEANARAKGKALPPSSIDRRQHERLPAHVTVRLLRHSVHKEDTGGASLVTETVDRSARNVSTGGIFVAVSRHELAQVSVGSVVHLQVATPAGRTFFARGVVMRRDADGLGLSWVQDSERVSQEISTLLELVRRTGTAARP